MLVRKENEIEIWNDKPEKGTGKKYILLAIAGMLIVTSIAVLAPFDFSVAEAYYVLAFLCSPCIFLIILGCIFMKKEKTDYMIAKINKENIEICKKNVKIPTQDIIRINKTITTIGSSLVIFYKSNEKERKYSLDVSPANKNLVANAIKEYNNNVEINEKTVRTII